MIARRALEEVERALDRQPAVLLLGPRHSGKTTVALEIVRRRRGLYLDLDLPGDRRRLDDPEAFFEEHRDRLVVFDAVRRSPDLFRSLKAVIDRGRRQSGGLGRFLVLGSTAFAGLRQGASLGGRLGRVEVGPLHLIEVEDGPEALDRLWLRGGLPLSWNAASDHESLTWRQELLLATCERDLRGLGSRAAASVLDEFLLRLARSQGAPQNNAALASGLPLSASTADRTIGFLADLHLLRRLRPYYRTLGRRLARSPRLYLRDSGLLHAQLGIADRQALIGHSIVEASWEGFVVETLLGVAPFGTRAYWYRAGGGAEVDLVMDLPGRDGGWVIDVQYASKPRIPRGFYAAVKDIRPERAFFVTTGDDRHPLRHGAEAIGLRELTQLVASV